MERWYRERKERRRKKRRREDLSAEVGSRQKQSREILGSLLLTIFEYAVNRVDRERQEEVRSLERGVREKSIEGEDSRSELKEDEKVRVTITVEEATGEDKEDVMYPANEISCVP